MVQIAGSYKLDKNENLGAYLKSLGASDELAQKAERPGLTVEVVEDGETYSFKSSSGITLSFTLNEEFDEPLPVPGVTIRSVANKEGDDKLIISSKVADGRTGTRTYEFTDSGFVLTLTSADVTAKRYYSKA